MPASRPIWALLVPAALATTLLAACGTSSSSSATAEQTAAPGQTGTAQAARFSSPLHVDNRMFPLTPGTQFVYRGKIVEGGEATPHSVVFTVTGLTKVVRGVPTVVAWDRDFLEGRLQEQELALFAQDDRGTLWNFGEYPEEYENGKFTGAPDTWIRGARNAYGGIHMLARPTSGAQYAEGRIRAIGFYDLSRVISTSRATCVRAGCFQHVLMVDEWSPGDPAGGHQIKYYAPGVGLIRVGARGGDSQEFLSLSAVRHLSRAGMAQVTAAVLAMDRRAYRVSKVYHFSQPATPRSG
jgi:hypothetical protein